MTINVNKLPWDITELPDFKTVLDFIYSNRSEPFLTCNEQNIFQLWTKEYIENLSKIIRKLIKDHLVLEVCAGDGSLSNWLRQYGVNIIATDNFSWGKRGKLMRGRRKPIIAIFEVKDLDALKAIDHYKPSLVIASWIPYGDNLDIEILKKKVAYFILIGEGKHGCTGTVEFWEKYKKLGYEEIIFKGCDTYNLCRTDYSFGREISQHSITSVFKLKNKTERNKFTLKIPFGINYDLEKDLKNPKT
jgi:hypothetical protein